MTSDLSPVTEEALPEGALKSVTVMFCDLVGSTQAIAGLPPEGAMKLYGAATDAMVRAIADAGGTVIDRMGDGVLAVFGAPVAQPDHARRACMAGLNIPSEVARAIALEPRLVEQKSRVRVGLNSAEVAVAIVRDGRRSTCKLYGEGVNLAARVQALAEPDSVLMTESTFALVDGICETADAGVRKLKGFEKATRLYKLISLKAESVESRVTSPLVGRVEELAALRGAIERARSGFGGLCLLFGQPGVGKTRLVEELRPVATDAAMRWVQGHSPPFSERLSYWPIIEILRELLNAPQDRERTWHWQEFLASLRELTGAEAEDIALYFGAVLGIALPAEAAERLPPVGSEAMMHQVLRSFYRFFKTLALERPLVLVLDDMQWADASSVAVIKHIAGIASESPLLIFGVARPDPGGLQLARHLSTSHPALYLERLLEPLPTCDAQALLDSLMPLDPAAVGLKNLVLGRAGGNPFFVEEIVRALKQADVVTRESGEQNWTCRVALDQVQIPESVKGTVLARIDRLDSDLRKTLCNAAVIGREFLYRILDAITDQGLKLDRQLDELRSLGLVSHGRHSAELEYMFKHAVVQEAVYSSVFEERRRKIHQRVAECLEGLFAHDLAPHYGLLAFHFYRSGRSDKAQEYLLRAADEAQRLAGDAEALAHLEQAMAMLDKSGAPELGVLDRARIERKLGQIRFRRGETEQAIPHFRRALRHLQDRDPETAAGVRAHVAIEMLQHLVLQACRRFLPAPGSVVMSAVDDERRMIYEHLGWCNYHTDQERLLLAILRGSNFAALRGDADALALSYAGIGYVFNLAGAFKLARRYIAQALDYARRSARAGTAALPLNVMGLHLLYTGDWDGAMCSYDEGVRCAAEASDSINWMSIHAQQALVFFHRGDLVRSFSIGGRMSEVGRESAMAIGLHWGLLTQGRALFVAGNRDEGVAMLRQAIVLAMRMPDYQCLGQTHGALALCLLDDDSCGAAADLVRAGLTIAREHNLFGHDAIELFLAHARVELLRAERARKEDRATATVSARRAGLHALRRSRVVSHAMSAALRGMARLAWFEGNRAGAMQWWADSLAAAERVGARLDVASTLIECGTLTADTESLARGHAVREELRQSSAQLRRVRV